MRKSLNRQESRHGNLVAATRSEPPISWPRSSREIPPAPRTKRTARHGNLVARRLSHLWITRRVPKVVHGNLVAGKDGNLVAGVTGIREIRHGNLVAQTYI